MKLTLNLASRRYLNRRAINQTCLLLLLLLGGWLAYQVVDYLQTQARLEALQEANAQLQQDLVALQSELPSHLSPQQLEQQQQQYAEAKGYLQRDAFRWTTLFDRMEERLPAGVSVRSFQPNYEDESLVMTGVAKDLSDLQTLLDSLFSEPFEQVYLQNQGRVEISDGRGGKVSALNFALKIEGVF